jgi:hypothetical protein
VVVVDLDLQPGGAKSRPFSSLNRWSASTVYGVSVPILLPSQFPDVIWPTPEQRERRTREALALDLSERENFLCGA